MRKLIHVDMDAFFVSVEIRDNPALANKPVAVGGKRTSRGVIATCNYIAREYGVRSAMPTSIALQKCPNLVLVPGRMSVYKEVSQQIHQILQRYTLLIEPLSLDEAYLDVTDCTMFNGSATLIAQDICLAIKNELNLTASAGIAPIKFLAKIASDLNKPNGTFTIAPNEVDAHIQALSLKKIPGVGKVTFDKLTKFGFHTGADIRNADEHYLVQHFGKFGKKLWQRCQGIDPRGIETSRIRKSVGVERTFSTDISVIEELEHILAEKLLPELELRSAHYLEQRAINKLGIKIKFNDFQQTTKEHQYHEIDLPKLLLLLREALARGQGKPVRLLGVHIGLSEKISDNRQLALTFD
ncbi:DNA polymerase IV [Thalassotalea sp. PLHSN55]|uniref:DNA polymerase IV n=1 Tax=Thalassotalea sp. PLHSN55 TaxID=3435888 RepID=UPI003F87FE92